LTQVTRTSADYEPANVQAAYSALLEVAASLQSYKGAMILIGGWGIERICPIPCGVYCQSAA
jgi:hypothetical protein